ncbi:MAG: hypothetical protein A4E48_01537 [Methanosaeta sp. PtaU1.Bin060]|nr:MAG: hypothetical protein A4E48_01537 [Methanosaeta sp. PtaU1.Bin060]
MKKMFNLGILIFLIAGCMVTTAVSQEQVTLTTYVHDGSLDGALLSGVQITGQDAGGNTFQGVTDSNGAAVFSGVSGTWAFSFTKDGYDELDLNYEVNETQEAAAYLQKASLSQEETESATEQVTLTVDVHDGSLDGALLSGVQIAGQDAGGNTFQGVTDSNGAAVFSGVPGTWAFSFTKDGYGELNLNYEVNETQEAAAYLEKST